jgi:hypothetical protein
MVHYTIRRLNTKHAERYVQVRLTDDQQLWERLKLQALALRPYEVRQYVRLALWMEHTQCRRCLACACVELDAFRERAGTFWCLPIDH